MHLPGKSCAEKGSHVLHDLFFELLFGDLLGVSR